MLLEVCEVFEINPNLHFYFTIQGMVKYCNRAWKNCFVASFFRNISKTAETILIKKIGWNHGISVYKKVLISEHGKIIFFEILIILSKCLLVSLCVTKFFILLFILFAYRIKKCLYCRENQTRLEILFWQSRFGNPG